MDTWKGEMWGWGGDVRHFLSPLCCLPGMLATSAGIPPMALMYVWAGGAWGGCEEPLM